jgi:hypothetical protein
MARGATATCLNTSEGKGKFYKLMDLNYNKQVNRVGEHP